MVALVLVLGCAGGDNAVGAKRATSTSDTLELPADPLDATCTAVAVWSHDLVDTTNAFGQETGDLVGPAERRQRYLDTWQGLREVTDRLRARLRSVDYDAVPIGDEVREALLDATERVDDEIADGVAESAALPDDSYEVLAVNNGGLNPSTEKMLSIVLKTLNGLSTSLDLAGLGGGCGR